MNIPQRAVDIFNSYPNPKEAVKEIVKAKIITSAGTPVSARTARSWKLEWEKNKDRLIENLPVADEHDPNVESITKHEEDNVLIAESVSSQIKNVEDLIEVCKIDMNIWERDHFEVRTYEGMRKNEHKDLHFDAGKITGTVFDEGQATRVLMFAVRAWFVKKQKLAYDEILPGLIDRLSTVSFPKLNKRHATGNHLIVPTIVDAHFGRLDITGKYTPGRALKEYKATVDAMVERTLALGVGIESVLNIIGNDLGNADSLDNKTTRGTQQEMSGGMRDVIDAAWEAEIYRVTRFLEIAPVHVEPVEGNHDRLGVYHLGKFISAWFRNDPDVTVSSQRGPRRYFSYGQTLIGMEHGDRVKAKQLAGLMADEAKEMWSQTTYRIFLRGHFHVENEVYQATSKEGGVSVITIPAFCPPNEWEKLMGYIGTQRAADVRLYHKEHGPALNFSVFVDELKI